MGKQRVPTTVRNALWSDVERNLDAQMSTRVYHWEQIPAFSNVVGRAFAIPRFTENGETGKWLSFMPLYAGVYIIDPSIATRTRSHGYFALPSEIYEDPTIITNPNQSPTLAKIAELARTEPARFKTELERQLGNFFRSGACSPLPFTQGVIAHAIKTGENQYIEDVANLPPEITHVSCDSGTEHSIEEPKFIVSEAVLIYSSQRPVTRENPHATERNLGKKGPVAVLDIDLLRVPGAPFLIKRDMGGMKRIWRYWGDRMLQDFMYNGQIAYDPSSDISLRDAA